MIEYKEVSKDEFGQMILTWQAHVETPLEVISLYKHYDDYLPAIKKYDPASSKEVMFILGGSYPTKTAAMAAIGSIWDLAEAK